MALYRKLRGTLEESLETTIIVKNIDDLVAAIENTYSNAKVPYQHQRTIKINIPGEMSVSESFDKRCGWYTHYVSCDFFSKDDFIIVGFLSEPLS